MEIWKNCIIKELGPSPLRSQDIQNHVTQKLLLGCFLIKSLFDQFRPNGVSKSFTWLESCDSSLCNGTEIFFLLQSVWFSRTLHTDIFLYTEKLSYQFAFPLLQRPHFFCTYLTFGGIGCYLQRYTYLGWANVKMLSVPRKLVLRNWEDFVCTTVLLFLFFTPQKSDITDGEILKEELN